MGNKFTNLISENLRKPTAGFGGWFVLEVSFKRENRYLEKSAVVLSQIKPDQNVLEVGFGPGYGIKEACQYVKDGKGKIYGLDLSEYMYDKAQKVLKNEIKAGKVELLLGSVSNLPYSNNNFDRVYHCNCYYFWSAMIPACAELYRVMKPHSCMVTTLNWERIQKHAKKGGVLSTTNTDMLQYMVSLEHVGFKNVHIEYLNDNGKNYQAIYAYVHNKSTITDAELSFEESELKREKEAQSELQREKEAESELQREKEAQSELKREKEAEK